MRYKARKLDIAWTVWDLDSRASAVVDGKFAVGLAEDIAFQLAQKLNEAPRFLVRKGIEGWMVWDRDLRGPAKLSGRPYTGLTKDDAIIIRDALIRATQASE